MWSSKSSPHSTESSQYSTHFFQIRPRSTCVSALAYVAVAFFSPKHMRLNWNCPRPLVPNAVYGLESGCSMMLQKALELSSVDMYFALPSMSSESSILANGNASNLVCRLHFLRSMHVRVDPSFFLTCTTWLQ